jgi:pilus assembly protein CpaC
MEEVELLILVTPQFVEAVDACDVPPGGPGLNSSSPNDVQFYLKGHVEVPRCPEDDQCAPSPSPGTATEGADGTTGRRVVPGARLVEVKHHRCPRPAERQAADGGAGPRMLRKVRRRLINDQGPAGADDARPAGESGRAFCRRRRKSAS